MSEDAVSYTFDEFELVLEPLGLLHRNMPVAAEQQTLKVLQCLLAAWPVVAKKADIFDHAWQGEFLDEDSNLHTQIMRLRDVLLDAGRPKTLIQTVRGVGYRVAADVKALTRRPGPEPIRLTGAGEPFSPAQPQSKIGFEHLGQSPNKHILGRDAEAQQLLDVLLNKRNRIVSIAAPAGFGKSAVMVRAIQKATGDSLDPLKADLKGIAVLNATADNPLGVFDFQNAIDRILGQSVASRTKDKEDTFSDVLSRAGKLWIVVENAERLLWPDITPEFRSVVVRWCAGDHDVKLILLTRAAFVSSPHGCHSSIRGVEAALNDGLREDAAITLLRQNLNDTSFNVTEVSLLREIAVRRLHCMPIAIETFAGYLRFMELDIETLDLKFLEANNPLRLFHKGQMERYFFEIIKEQFSLFDATSLQLLHLMVWADIPMPHAGLLAFERALGSADEPSLTRIVRSNLLVRVANAIADGGMFTMHALIREAARENLAENPLDLLKVARAMRQAGTDVFHRNLFSLALTCFVLWERALRQLVNELGRSDLESELAAALRGRGAAYIHHGRFEDAEKDFDEAVRKYLRLVNDGGHEELEGELALAVMDRGGARGYDGRLEEAEKDHDEAVGRFSRLLEDNARPGLESDLAYALKNRGLSREFLGRLDQAEKDYDEAVERYRRLIKDRDRVDLEASLAGAIGSRGAARLLQKRWAEADIDHDEAVERYLRLVKDKGRKDLESNLAAALTNRGLARKTRWRWAEAEKDQLDAVEMYSTLVNDRGRRDIESNLAKAIANLAAVWVPLGRLEDAERGFEDAIDRLSRLVADGRADLRSVLASILTSQGAVRGSLGRSTEEEKDLDDAIRIYRDLLKDTDRPDLRVELANAMVNRGVARVTLGRFDEAEKDYHEATELYLRLGNGKSSVDTESRLAKVLMNLGWAYKRQKRLGEAERYLSEAIEKYQRSAEREQALDMDSELASAFMHRGDLYGSQDRFEEEEKDYDDAVRIYVRLAGGEDRLELQSSLANALVNRGAARAALGRLDEAETDLDQSAAIYRRLVKELNRLDLQGAMAGAIRSHGLIRVGQERWTDAQRDLGEAIEIYRRLVDESGRLDLEADFAGAYLVQADVVSDQGDQLAAIGSVREAVRRYSRLVSRGQTAWEDKLTDARELDSKATKGAGRVFHEQFDPDDGQFPDAEMRRRIQLTVSWDSSVDFDILAAVKRIIESESFTQSELQVILDHLHACLNR